MDDYARNGGENGKLFRGGVKGIKGVYKLSREEKFFSARGKYFFYVDA